MTSEWDMRRWPHFSQKELSCKCGCGLFIKNEKALDALQRLRNAMGPLAVSSAVRCAKHNRKEGGAISSEHLHGRAFDVLVGPHDRARLLYEAKKAGFSGFGFGSQFLHVDVGRARHWDYGLSSRKAWEGIMP